MLKYLFAVLFIPQLLRAQQEVKPVISSDYLSLINSDSLLDKRNDTTPASKKSWILKQPYPYIFPVKEIKLHHDNASIVAAKNRYLFLAGNYTSGAALENVNAMPKLQNKYAQGRSINRIPTWQGPETGELFNYGPSLKALEYDGSAYPYDVNGRLVNTGAGIGEKATAYGNSVFRTGYLLSNSFSLIGNSRHNYSPPDWLFSFRASKSKEATVLGTNDNTQGSYSASLERYFHSISVSGGYTYFTSHFSDGNRAGFLNRVYQNSLLTPASFDNTQGYLLANGKQRSYSNSTDNPGFLLTDNGRGLDRTQQTGNLSVQKKYGYFTFSAVSSIDAVDENSNEPLKPGTAYFAAGQTLNRKQNDRHYNLDVSALYNVRYGTYHFQSVAKINYVYNDDKINIAYLPAAANYNYKRASNDASVAYNTTYEKNYVSASFNAGDKFYTSTTTNERKYFLPDLSGFVRFNDLFDYTVNAKLISTYNVFYSEPVMYNSYALYALTQLAPQDAFKFTPVTEVQSYNNLQPIRHSEFTTKLELTYEYKINLNADMFIRKTVNEVFPVYQNGALVLKNLADTRFTGLELQLELWGLTKYYSKFSMHHCISFYKWNNEVTRVETGLDNIPVAGFANVHKTIIKGQPLGVIVGNSYARDGNGNIVIGSDGFPAVNNNLSVIGNPVPDFTLKFSHYFYWKNFACVIDWEYKKGGDVWNGTQAILDYYGRSATTGAERNYSGYIFAGVNQNGRPNNIAVKFYDASLPVEENRWTRYGYTGVAESYIQKADAIRIHHFSIGYVINFKKYLQRIQLTAYADNLVIWSAYKGADANQQLFGQPGSQGLDFFNLPSNKSFGVNASIQF